jgi:hypothetical protein
MAINDSGINNLPVINTDVCSVTDVAMPTPNHTQVMRFNGGGFLEFPNTKTVAETRAAGLCLGTTAHYEDPAWYHTITECWMRFDADISTSNDSASNMCAAIGKGRYYAHTNSWFLGVYKNPTSGRFIPAWLTMDAGSYDHYTYGHTELLPDTWYHMCMMWWYTRVVEENNRLARVGVLYVNGQPQLRMNGDGVTGIVNGQDYYSQMTTSVGGWVNGDSGNLFIGTNLSYGSNSTNDSNRFKGYITDVRHSRYDKQPVGEQSQHLPGSCGYVDPPVLWSVTDTPPSFDVPGSRMTSSLNVFNLTSEVNGSVQSSVDEDGEFVIKLETSGLPNGTIVHYTINGLQERDLVSGTLVGQFVVNNGVATKLFKIVADTLNEGVETFELVLATGESIEMTVNDTSTGSSGTVNEQDPADAPNPDFGFGPMDIENMEMLIRTDVPVVSGAGYPGVTLRWSDSNNVDGALKIENIEILASATPPAGEDGGHVGLELNEIYNSVGVLMIENVEIGVDLIDVDDAFTGSRTILDIFGDQDVFDLENIEIAVSVTGSQSAVNTYNVWDPSQQPGNRIPENYTEDTYWDLDLTGANDPFTQTILPEIQAILATLP